MISSDHSERSEDMVPVSGSRNKTLVTIKYIKTPCFWSPMKGVNVNKELILKVAENARLSLTDREVEQFVKEFREILEAFSKIDEVDTKRTESSMQPVELKNVLREDRTEPSISQEDALKNTAHTKDGYFKGPRAV